jgi:hypothetical protein
MQYSPLRTCNATGQPISRTDSHHLFTIYRGRRRNDIRNFSQSICDSLLNGIISGAGIFSFRATGIAAAFFFIVHECTGVSMRFRYSVGRVPHLSSECMQQLYYDLHALHKHLFKLTLLRPLNDSLLRLLCSPDSLVYEVIPPVDTSRRTSLFAPCPKLRSSHALLLLFKCRD